MSAAAVFKGFTVRSVPLSRGSPFCREILCKEHSGGTSDVLQTGTTVNSSIKKASSGVASSNTVLFVTHIDKLVEEDDLKKHFRESCGPVEHVTLKRSLKPHQNIALRRAGMSEVTTLAHVKFSKRESLLKALQPSDNALDSVSSVVPIPHVVSFTELIQRSIDKYRDIDILRDEVDEAMAAYDAEKEKLEKQKAESVAGVDADGFVVVSRHGGVTPDGTRMKASAAPAAPDSSAVSGGSAAASQSHVASTAAEFSHITDLINASGKLGDANMIDETYRRKKKGGRCSDTPDFYRFQLIQQKREELAKLRSQRMEDEIKVSELREKNIFKKIRTGIDD